MFASRTDGRETVIRPTVIVQIDGPKNKKRKTAKSDTDTDLQHRNECTEDVLSITDIIAHTVPKLAAI